MKVKEAKYDLDYAMVGIICQIGSYTKIFIPLSLIKTEIKRADVSYLVIHRHPSSRVNIFL